MTLPAILAAACWFPLVQVDTSPDTVLAFPTDDPQETAGYGECVAIEGDTVLVSGPGQVGVSNSGTILAWQRTESGYEVRQQIVPEVCIGIDLSNCLFGRQFAVEGDLLFANSIGGNPADPASRGLVHVFRRIQGVWTATDWIRGRRTVGPFASGFGEALDVSGSTLAIGAGGFETGVPGAIVGAVHLYEIHEAGTTRFVETLLPPSSPSAPQGFGFSVALSAHNLLVGRPTFGGTAHLYRRDSGGSWQLAQTFVRPIGTTTQVRFGSRVAMTDDEKFLFIGDAHFSLRESPGRVFVYRRNQADGSYQHTQILEGIEPGQPGPNSNLFGSAIDASNDLLAVGSIGQYVSDVPTGAVQVYRLVGDTWEFESRMIGTPSPAGAPLALGRDVAVGDRRVVGSDTQWSIIPPFTIGRAYLWDFPSAAEICGGSDPGLQMNVARVDDVPGRIDVTVSGFIRPTIAVLAAGMPTHLPGAPGGNGTLCLTRPFRVSDVHFVPDGQTRLLASGLQVARGMTTGVAVQLFTLDRTAPDQVRFGPAQLMVE
ncbi:MAG: hypothetical protein AAGB93_21930 [Planctomycetota bacterium]